MHLVMDVWSPANPPRILHGGAHLGEERDAYEQAGADWVLWCEANPALLDPLRAHLCEPRPIVRPTCHTVAHALLGADSGDRRALNVAADTMNSSVLGEGLIPVDYERVEGMPVTTVDDLTTVYGQPTMLALDCQGYELEILRGSVLTLPGVELVYTEVSEVPIYDGAPHWREIDGFLAGQGFRLAKIEMDRNGAGWGDGCWLRIGCG